MSIQRVSLFALPLILSAGPALADDVTPLSHPTVSSLKPNTVVCSHPESLFLIYEGSTIAMGGGGSEAFNTYFNAAGRLFEARSECLVQSAGLKVTVDAYTTMRNPLKQESAVYGRFGVDGSDSKVWATIGNLPEFESEARRLGLLKQSTAPVQPTTGSKSGPSR